MAFVIFSGRNGPSHAPSGHAVGLRHAVDRDGAIAHAVERDHRNVLGAVVDDVLVDLVGDGEDIEFDAQVADQFQFFAGEDLAGGIVRSIEDDGFGVFVEGAAQFFFVEGPLAGFILWAGAASRISVSLRSELNLVRSFRRTARRLRLRRPRCRRRGVSRSWLRSIRSRP